MVNVGSFDRLLRALFGIALLVLPLVSATAAPLSRLGLWIWVLPAVGVVLLLTAIFRICPAYTLLGIRSCATK